MKEIVSETSSMRYWIEYEDLGDWRPYMQLAQGRTETEALERLEVESRSHPPNLLRLVLVTKTSLTELVAVTEEKPAKEKS